MPMHANIVLNRKSLCFLFAMLPLLLCQFCAPTPPRPPSPPLGKERIARILAALREEGKSVSTFFSAGKLAFHHNGSGHEADILIFGTRTPFRLKLELKHPWGRPLMHLLIMDSQIEILSFSEKRCYSGSLSEAGKFGILPEGMLSVQLWALVRGLPSVLPYSKAISVKGDQISLLDANSQEVEIIDFYPESDRPRRITFPMQGIRFILSGYERTSGILYATNTRLESLHAKNALALKLIQVVFNRAIPEPIFELHIPAGFKTISLKEAGR